MKIKQMMVFLPRSVWRRIQGSTKTLYSTTDRQTRRWSGSQPSKGDWKSIGSCRSRNNWRLLEFNWSYKATTTLTASWTSSSPPWRTSVCHMYTSHSSDKYAVGVQMHIPEVAQIADTRNGGMNYGEDRIWVLNGHQSRRSRRKSAARGRYNVIGIRVRNTGDIRVPWKKFSKRDKR